MWGALLIAGLLLVALIIYFWKKMAADVADLENVKREFGRLREAGLSYTDAFVAISEQRHPELSKDTHLAMATTLPTIFAWQAFMRQALDFGDMKKHLDDEEVKAMLEVTTFIDKGYGYYIANVDWETLKKRH